MAPGNTARGHICLSRVREKNKSYNEIDHPNYKGVIMAEPAIETTETFVETQVEETSRLKAFTLNHPRTAKVVGFAAVTAATLGAISVWKSRQQEDDETEVHDADVVPFDASSKTA